MLVIPNWVHEALLVAVVVFAWWKGGRAEQVAASVLLITILAFEVLWFRLMPVSGRASDGMVLVRDALQAVILIGLALGTHRYWAIVVAALALVGVGVSVSQLVRPVHGWTFGTAEIALMHLQLITITVGVCQTWAASRRAARAGG